MGKQTRPAQGKTIDTGVLFRSLSVREDGIDTEKRTVELSFSSDEPYMRHFGWEILDHNPKSVRLGRLKAGGPLLDTHYGDQIGVVESVGVDGKAGRALVRFSRGARADEIFQDVIDGIRRNVSVGYVVHEKVLEKSSGEEETYRVTDWEPYEISMVPVPADATVGVGRAGESETIKTRVKGTETMEKEETKQAPQVIERVREMTDDEKAQAIAVYESDVRSAELKRMSEIEAIADQFPQMKELCDNAKRNGMAVEQVREAALKELGMKKRDDAVAREKADIGMTDKEVKQFSLQNAIRSFIRNGRLDGLEKEASDAVTAKRGKEPRTFWVPEDVLRKDLTVAGTGSNVVATDLLMGSFIDLLRNKMVMTQLGVTELNVLVGDIAIPKHTTASTAYWVSENADITESTPVLGQITATPKTVGGLVDVSRKLIQQTSMDVEQFIRNDIASTLAIGIDLAALSGTGADGQPSGLVNNSDIADVTCTAAAPTFAQIASFDTEIETDNADIGSMKWLTTPAIKAILKTTEKASNTAQFLMTGNEMDGAPVIVSNQVTANYLWKGVWSQLVMAYWGGLDVLVDPYTGSAAGTVRIVAFKDCDVLVRHGQSFAYTDDITG